MPVLTLAETLALAAPERLLLYNTGDAFRPGWLRTLYRNAGGADELRLEPGRFGRRIRTRISFERTLLLMF